jgi:hypothetical protein
MLLAVAAAFDQQQVVLRQLVHIRLAVFHDMLVTASLPDLLAAAGAAAA